MKDAEIHGKDSTGVIRVIRTDASGRMSAGASGIARTTNPTAVADGADVSASFDSLGRQLVTPYQVRDLVRTAYVQLTNGTETTLLAGAAGAFFDLVSVTCANTSSAALGALTDVDIDFRDATGGGVVASIVVQDQDTQTINFPVPIPQNTAAATWTAKMDDVTGTTVNVTALFIRNV